jgi:hypothetical protein
MGNRGGCGNVVPGVGRGSRLQELFYFGFVKAREFLFPFDDHRSLE